MYAQTKRRTFFQIGMLQGVMGALLALVGVYYVNTPSSYFGTNVYNLATQRASTLWGGILIVCFALRNVTLSYPSSRFASDGMWDTCSAIFTNLITLLLGAAVVGITIWGHIDFFQNADIDTLDNSNELVNVITILLLGTLVMLSSLVGCIVSCFPISDGQAGNGGEQFAMDNQGFNKH